MAEVAAQTPLVNLSEIAEIELFILKRMKEFTLGDHASLFKGSGFNFVGIRDWQPGDRVSSIDWAQSSLNNFSPLITREFEQDSNATIVAVADASLSTRCGVNGVPIAAAVARALATIGMSAVFFQDMFGMLMFDSDMQHLSAVRPRIGAVRQTDAVEQGASPLFRREPLHARHAQRCFHDVLQRSHVRKQLKVLKDHAE